MQFKKHAAIYQEQQNTIFPSETSLWDTYVEFFHGVLNSFPQHPGAVTHQIRDMETLAQGHKLSVFVSVSEDEGGKSTSGPTRIPAQRFDLWSLSQSSS